MSVKNGRSLITNLQTEAVSTMPPPGHATADLSPESAEAGTAILVENPELDEFVARCLAQLRKVMDGLQ